MTMAQKDDGSGRVTRRGWNSPLSRSPRRLRSCRNQRLHPVCLFDSHRHAWPPRPRRGTQYLRQPTDPMIARKTFPALCLAATMLCMFAASAAATNSGQEYLPKAPSSGQQSSSSSSGGTSGGSETTTSPAIGETSGGNKSGKGNKPEGQKTDTTSVLPASSTNDSGGGSSGTVVIVLLLVAGIIAVIVGFALRRRHAGPSDTDPKPVTGGDETT